MISDIFENPSKTCPDECETVSAVDGAAVLMSNRQKTVGPGGVVAIPAEPSTMEL